MRLFRWTFVFVLAFGFLQCGCNRGSNSNPTPLPPSGLSYAVSAATYTVGTATAADIPTVSGGAVTSYSVIPTLPPGLSLNSSTGAMSGTPTKVSAAASYTISASRGIQPAAALRRIFTCRVAARTTCLSTPTTPPQNSGCWTPATRRTWGSRGKRHRAQRHSAGSATPSESVWTWCPLPMPCRSMRRLRCTPVRRASPSGIPERPWWWRTTTTIPFRSSPGVWRLVV